MTESQILTLNERVKGFSNYFFNLSAALAAAAVLIAFLLLLVAYKVLYLLEAPVENAP